MTTSNFSWFVNYTNILNELPDDEQKLAFAVGIANYGTHGIEPEYDDLVLRMAFEGIKPNIDSSRRKSQNGQKGGKAKARNESERRAQAAKDYILPSSNGGNSSQLDSTLASQLSNEWNGKDMDKETANVVRYVGKDGQPVSFGEVTIPQAR